MHGPTSGPSPCIGMWALNRQMPSFSLPPPFPYFPAAKKLWRKQRESTYPFLPLQFGLKVASFIRRTDGHLTVHICMYRIRKAIS